MKELIFSIEEIFDKQTQRGCLFQYESEFYHIPAYQRGYKWGADTNGAVTILLNDLWMAYQKATSTDRKEYYLQYITVKPVTIEERQCLEVIDGQQRLTTLSLLLSTIFYLLDNVNLADKKLDYAIRENFFEDYVYKKDSLAELLSKNWHEHITENEDFNKQDIYYLFHSVQKCHSFLSQQEVKSELESFADYILRNVKLIVNSVETHISSESVFSNLNSNKVPLTETELIKGLYITKVGRSKTDNHQKHFQEIVEIRSNIGRQWDEMSSWANQPEIRNIYFSQSKDGMRELLVLTAMVLSGEKIKVDQNEEKGEYPLFNLFLNHEGYLKAFSKLVEIKNILESWFLDNVTYNYIGFLRLYKGTDLNTRTFIVQLLEKENKPDLLQYLKEKKTALFEEINLEEVNYSESPNEIHQILLALNVFIEGQENLRFDFYQYKLNDWTLEHIFPQTPEGKNQVLNVENKLAIRNMLGESLTDEIETVLTKPERSSEEKEVYYKALKEHKALNSLGNMCLLTGGDNASNGNKFFNDKRENILRLIRKGSFVPRHTFDLFSKMFKGADIDQMKAWSVADIAAHEQHIINSIHEIK